MYRIRHSSDAAHGGGEHIISDGGIVVHGDMAKGFGGGADFIMSGSMISGHDECTGDIDHPKVNS